MSNVPYDEGLHEPGETWYGILRPEEWDNAQVIEVGLVEGPLEDPFNFGDDENEGDGWWVEEGSMFSTEDEVVDTDPPGGYALSDFIWALKREDAVEVLRAVIIREINELADKYRKLRK